MSPMLKTFLGCCYCTLAVLFFSQTASAKTNEFRGIWTDAWQNHLHSASAIDAMLAQMRSANLNAVVGQIRRRGDSLYVSNYEPKISQLANNSFDPLAYLTQQAHNTNNGPRIEVHAWIVTYPIWSGATNTLVTNHPLYLHPDWLSRSNSVNGPVHTGGASPRWQFDPAHPEVQKHTFNVAMDIISRYDVDGFNFDYIRYPEYGQVGNYQPWGYNPVSVARFNAKYGRTGEPAPDDPDWSEFRRDQVTALLRKIYLSAIAIKPHVKISADTITWGHHGVTNTAQWSTNAAYYGVLQDWRSWMEEGILDLNIPMNYYRHHNTIEPQNHAKAYTNWANFAMDHAYNRQVAIGPGLYLNSIENGLVQLRHSRSVTAAGNSAVGSCGYVFHQTNKDGQANSIFYNALVNPTAYDPVTPPMYAQPATIPPMPWKTAPIRGHLKGFVSGSSPTNYLEDGAITITGPESRTLYSDVTGFYGAVDLVPGNYSATASFPGYADVTSNFTVTAGLVADLDFLLPSTAVHFVEHPAGLVTAVGTDATFSVTATSETALSYQWLFNNFEIPGATGSAFTRTNVQYSHEGNYSVAVSNSFGGTISSNAFLRVVSPLRTTGMELLWNLPPGSRPYLTTNGTERGLAYNSVSGNLLLASRAGGAKIYVLNADTGAEIRTMNTDTDVIQGGYQDFTLQMLGTGEDGAVYGCNMVLAPGNGFKIYRWNNDAAETVPTVAFSGNPWPANEQRWGDTFDVRGSGTNTLILVGARTGSSFCILTTENGVDFTPRTFSVPSVTGGLGLAFGLGNTFWGKNIANSLKQVEFDLATQTANIVNTISTAIVPDAVTAIGVNPALDLIAGVTIETPDAFHLYDFLSAPPALIASENFPDLPNVNGTGSVDFGRDRVYALNSNNGILALRLIPRWPISIQSVMPLENGKIGLLTDSDPVAQSIEASSDLIEWQVLTTQSPTNGYFEITDPETNSTHRFYRTKVP